MSETIDALIALVCSAVNDRKKSHNTQLRENVVQHILTYYMDPNLSLWSVADAFGVTEKYLSDFFKEQTGIAFHTYVTDLRMERAKELMESGISIADVAHEVGYSHKSFSRAFKRLFGVSPTEYRKTLRMV